MRARQYGHNKGKRRGNQAPAPLFGMRWRDEISPATTPAANGYQAIKSLGDKAGHLSSQVPNKRQASGAGWPKPAKALSRNDVRTYHWQAPGGRVRQALPGIDNGPNKPRSILSPA